MKKTFKTLLYILLAIVAFIVIRAGIITIFWWKRRIVMETKEIIETKAEENVFEEKDAPKKRTVTFKIKYKTILKLSVLLIVFIVGFVVGFKINNRPIIDPDSSIVDNPIINITPDIDVTYLNTALKEASELTTAKLKINGLVDFKDTGIIILNKSDFTMKYTADISAGIDMSKVEIKNDDIDHENKKIIVEIPKAIVFKPNVYHGDKYIKFYDEKFALFNVNEKEDLSRALAMAEKDAESEAVENGLLELADKQSETLVKGILSDAVSQFGYSIEIKYLNEEKK